MVVLLLIRTFFVDEGGVCVSLLGDTHTHAEGTLLSLWLACYSWGEDISLGGLHDNDIIIWGGLL